MNPKRTNNPKKGFTIIELLVVMGIIALLIGILVPGMRGVTKISRDLKQKAQFHSIEVGLETFLNDFGEYPESSLKTDGAGDWVCGAQHLAEAMAGRDLRGLDPLTQWNPALAEENSDTVRYASVDKGSTPAEISASEMRRKNIYVELEDIRFAEIRDIYQDTGNVFPSTDAYHSPVITSVAAGENTKKISTDKGEFKVGAPVLYFKARSDSKWYGEEAMDSSIPYRQWIYWFQDNAPILSLGKMANQTETHPWFTDPPDEPPTPDGDMGLFYETIRNPAVDTYDAPYNARRFILAAPGWDGLYGTGDDLLNFER